MTAALLRKCVGCKVSASFSSVAIERCDWMATLHFNVVLIVLQGTHRDGWSIVWWAVRQVSGAHSESLAPKSGRLAPPLAPWGSIGTISMGAIDRRMFVGNRQAFHGVFLGKFDRRDFVTWVWWGQSMRSGVRIEDGATVSGGYLYYDGARY